MGNYHLDFKELSDTFDEVLTEILPEHSLADLIRLRNQIFHRLLIRCGGVVCYLPRKDTRFRNALIKQEFTGNNHHILAKRYDLSVPQIYRILRDVE